LGRIRLGHGTPLLGEKPQFTEDLNGATVGDTGDADEQLQGILELLADVNEVAGLLAQVFDLGVEFSDAVRRSEIRKSGTITSLYS